MDESNSAARPGPSTTSQAVPSTASTPLLCLAITAHSIIIQSPDHKGKGKAHDDEEMAIDLANIALPGDNKDDAEGEPEDSVEADPTSDLSAAE
ncbi:hypothetical protein H2248_001572 [Termitomyces sp. 'cryptogamus']|nr:hypothetical protein H2248_001572 [Termitomyces sp. 'cryptogamus']